MKQRLLVMNGQRIIQAGEGEKWTNQKVEKSAGLKPGIYNIFMAQKPDKAARHDGTIVHADGDSVFQKTGKGFVEHARADFDKVPEIGSTKSISYGAQGKASVSAENVSLSRSRSR